MSLDAFVKKCGAWGLLPNNGAATNAYGNMKVMGPLMGNAGYSAKLNKLCMHLPDISDLGSLEQLKGTAAGRRLSIVLTCHEVLHNLHFMIDKGTFISRSKAGVAAWDNEEELLTITGDTGSVALPSAVQVACQPRLFNEHSLCRILKLSCRADHHSAPVDAATASTIDLTAMPMGIPMASWDWGGAE